MSKHVGEKCGKLRISSILSSKRGITPTNIDKNDETQNWSGVHKKEIMCKISAQYFKACWGKVGKLCISSILSSKRGLTSTKIDANRHH